MSVDEGSGPRRFVLENTKPDPVPFVPEIRLQQASEAHDLWQKTEAELDALGLPPPFWAFAWAGGQALARYLLDHPETVRGKRLIDFASGSGLVAIAAMKAGAASVVALDVDPFCAAAIAENACINDVPIRFDGTDRIGERLDADMLLAGDTFYDGAFAARLIPWFDELASAGLRILVGDPMRTYLPATHLRCLARYAVPVHPALENGSTKQAAVFAWQKKSQTTGLP